MDQQINFNKIFKELKKIEQSMVTRNEMSRFIETLEILSNPDTMQQIRDSEKDISLGNIKEINSASDL